MLLRQFYEFKYGPLLQESGLLRELTVSVQQSSGLRHKSDRRAYVNCRTKHLMLRITPCWHPLGQ
jgi:hypothetical protein